MCSAALTYEVSKTSTSYYCTGCEEHDVSGFVERWEPGYTLARLVTRNLRMEDFYIRLDYVNNTTVVSRIEACFLTDSVRISRLLSFDSANPQSLLHQVKFFMVFS